MGDIIKTVTTPFKPIVSVGRSLTGQSDYVAEEPGLNPEALEASNRNYNNTVAQQDILNSILRNQAANGSPLAQAQLQEATNKNIANAAGLVTSQKGLNPALAARLAGKQAAGLGQDAANQSAQLQALTQSAAQNQLGGNLATQGQQALGYQSILQGSRANANQTNARVQIGNAQNLAQTLQSLVNAGGGVLAKGSTAKAPVGASRGGRIGGEAQVRGDSEQNDTVPAMLSPGEIVVPRTKAKDPEMAKEFIDHLMKNQGKGEKSFSDVMVAHRKLHDRLSKLEKRMRHG